MEEIDAAIKRQESAAEDFISRAEVNRQRDAEERARLESLRTRLAAAEAHERRLREACEDYKGLQSELADITRRIGLAATPEWIRGKLEELIARHQRWNSAALADAPAGEAQPAIDDKEIEAAGDAYHKQFISHPPKRSDYLGGFIVGAYWMRDRLTEPREAKT